MEGMGKMTPEEFAKYLEECGFSLSDKQKRQFQLYFEQLVEWNEKMNLTAITEEKEVYLKHFVDSIAPITQGMIQDESLLVVDIGAGAGFPSLPMIILFPKLDVTIVDSLQKRITFLTHLAEVLELENVHFIHGRAEELGQQPSTREGFDLAFARAVARMSVLSELCLPFVKKDGKFIALKASKADEEMKDAKKAIAVLGGKVEQVIDYELPVTHDPRTMICIQKTKETPKKYPRKAGLPNKKPIQ